MKKWNLLRTLDSRIYLVFILVLLAAILIVQLVSFQFTVDTVRNSALENSRTLLGQLTSQIDTYISEMNQIAEIVSDDKQLRDYLENGSDEHTRKDILLKLRSYLLARTDISNILIMDIDGQVFSADPEFIQNPWTSPEEKAWYRQALANDSGTYISNAYVQNISLEKYPWVVSISKSITSSSGSHAAGILLIDLKFNQIKDLCQSMKVGRKGYNFILDHEGNYVFHPTQQLVYSDIQKEPLARIMATLSAQENSFSDADKHYNISLSFLTGWYVVNVTHDSDIITDWKYLVISYTLLGLIMFFAIGIVANRISSGITRPLRKLQDIMKSVDTGEFRLVGKITATDEIRELAREYDLMVTNIRELMAANIREQDLKRKSDLKALQAQINPHFLYNTLDSIIWMGEMKQHEKVVQMTSALSKLFRISISRGREIISLADELAHVESYLIIQEMRYRDIFSYSIRVDPELMHLSVLKITLQPLVENAIYHGIKEAGHQGQIEIRGHTENKLLVLEVRDNGIGMDEETLKTLLRHIDRPESESPTMSRHGMGVRNVHERIRLYFGTDYGIECSSAPGKGTLMKVILPAVNGENDS